MKVIFTVEALADLDGILAFVATNHPTVSTALDRQIRTVLGRISAWPESAREVLDRRGGTRRSTHAISVPDIL